MTTFSHSRLSTFEQCPLRFKFNYIDKVKTEIEETVESFLGSRVHNALEKLYKDMKFQKLLELKELLDYYESEWEKNWNDSIMIVRDEYDVSNYKKMGQKFIEDYYKRYHPFNQTKTIGLETLNLVDLDNDRKYKIHIRIDRLALTSDNVYEIHDYKTANSLPTQEYLDKDRQLAIYAWGIKKMYPDAKKIRLVWHYLAFDKEMSLTRTDNELESLRKQILELIHNIEKTDEFVPKQSALCKWCNFIPICPNFKHMYELEKKPVNEYLNDDGVKLVNKYTEINEYIKNKSKELEKIKEALLNYCNKENLQVVYGSDVSAFVKSYPKISFPKKDDMNRAAFVDVIKKIGLYEQLSTIDVYELSKRINNGSLHPDLIRLIEPYLKRDKTTRVYLRKK